MALFSCSFFSKSLLTTTKITVIIPSPTSRQAISMPLRELYSNGLYDHKNIPVLYLLHGMFEDETTWLRRSNIERYAQEESIVVVMPYAENSYYLDMAHGSAYFTYMTKELPLFLKNTFGICHDRNKTAVAGLSMGGYGAFLMALCCPECFYAFASLSGALDLEWITNIAKEQGLSHFVDNVVGENAKPSGSAYDLFYLTQNALEKEESLPQCYLSCGVEDESCYGMNQKMKKHLDTIGYPHVYIEGPGGHEWDYWDKEIRNVLKWLKTCQY